MLLKRKGKNRAVRCKSDRLLDSGFFAWGWADVQGLWDLGKAHFVSDTEWVFFEVPLTPISHQDLDTKQASHVKMFT